MTLFPVFLTVFFVIIGFVLGLIYLVIVGNFIESEIGEMWASAYWVVISVAGVSYLIALGLMETMQR